MAIKLMMSDEKPKRPIGHQKQPGGSVETLLRAVLRRLDKKIEEKDDDKRLVKFLLIAVFLSSIANAVLTCTTIILLLKGAR